MFNINKKRMALLVLLMAFISPAMAVSTAFIQPVTQKVNLDGSFIFYMNVTAGNPIAGMQTNIKFDPTIIRIDSITEGNLFNRNYTTFFSPGKINNTLGTVENIFNVVIGPHAVTGSGIFIEIHGTPIKRGTSKLEPYIVKVAKSDATAESVTYTNGTIVVGYPSWDVNEDGVTDILDVVLVTQHFGESSVGRWDVNGMPPVDIADVVITAQKMPTS